MKDAKYLLYGFAGFSGFTLASTAGYLWLPKSQVLWFVPLSGMFFFNLVLFLCILVFAIWSIAVSANARRDAELDYGLPNLVQALLPSLFVLIAFIVVQVVAVWLIS